MLKVCRIPYSSLANHSVLLLCYLARLLAGETIQLGKYMHFKNQRHRPSVSISGMHPQAFDTDQNNSIKHTKGKFLVNSKGWNTHPANLHGPIP